MTRKDIYKIWAPSSAKWTDWVRPVSFIELDQRKEILEVMDYDIPNIYYLDNYLDDTAIILDISGGDSIKEGIALAKLGYRPIPIFNGTNPPLNAKSTTNNSFIEPYLIWGAFELKKISLKDEANPVFLLDSNRLNRYKINRGIFDNSWDIYPQDIPSSKYFLDHGITRILVRGNSLSNDLSKILYQFQDGGLTILFTNGYEEPKEIKIKKSKMKDF